MPTDRDENGIRLKIFLRTAVKGVLFYFLFHIKYLIKNMIFIYYATASIFLNRTLEGILWGSNNLKHKY